MARKKRQGPTWDQLTDEQKGRFDKLFRLILRAKAKRAQKSMEPK